MRAWARMVFWADLAVTPLGLREVNSFLLQQLQLGCLSCDTCSVWMVHQSSFKVVSAHIILRDDVKTLRSNLPKLFRACRCYVPDNAPHPMLPHHGCTQVFALPRCVQLGFK